MLEIFSLYAKRTIVEKVCLRGSRTDGSFKLKCGLAQPLRSVPPQRRSLELDDRGPPV
jgi:hypothetical protein